jgi:serine/threonine-protein kinase
MILPGRYKEVGVRLRGGMGEVLQCDDLVLQRKVAIKTIPSGSDLRRIKDEISALLKLRSKHVVQVYDLLQGGDGSYGIVQEFISGPDLSEEQTRPLDTQGFYRTLWQIAAGIDDIHKQGVIHRDIKPNNMKVDPEGVIKIFDFGLARDEGADAKTMGFVGTFGFAAPELFLAPAEFSSAIDVFAFGSTALYLLFGGIPPSMRGVPSLTAPVENLFLQSPFPIAQEISDLLYKCLAPVAEQRPQMSEVKDVLSKYLLAGKHQALLVFQGRAHHLNARVREVRLNLPQRGSITVRYDDLQFYVAETSGDVYINNLQASVGRAMPGSCVVALGSLDYPAQRRYITFDLSHPEIVL